MRAPYHERQAMLGEAIHRASEELRTPIDRLEVADGYVRCWAGSKMVTMSYDYAQGGSLNDDGSFTPHAGSGSWVVEVVPDPVLKRSTWWRAIARLTRTMTG